jgi:HAMP domain-containing protein
MVWLDPLLRTRVARRIVLLFLLAALAPLCAFATLSSWMVAKELRRQTSEQLRASAKDLAMAATQSLQYVEAQLRLRAGAILANDAGPRRRTVAGLDSRVEALVVIDASGRTLLTHGEIVLPAVSEAQRRRLEADGAVLLVQPPIAGGRPTLLLIVPIEPRGGRAIAQLDERLVWNLGEDSARPALVGLCVFGPSGIRLACSEDLRDATVTPPAPPSASAGRLEWSSAEGQMLGAYWSAPLFSQFSIPTLTFLLARPATDVESPIQRFRRAFAVVVAVTLALMAWVSLRQIRRTLGPLVSLQTSAEQIRRGAFDARVQVTSRDEFAALGDSFNQMAAEVQRQFTELK